MAISLIGTFVGSTKGYDQFYSKKIDVTEMGRLYSKDIHYPPQRDQSKIQPFMIRYAGKEKCNLVGSWDNWAQTHALTYHSETQTYYTTLYLPPGHYEYKFKSEDNKWFLEPERFSNHNSNH